MEKEFKNIFWSFIKMENSRKFSVYKTTKIIANINHIKKSAKTKHNIEAYDQAWMQWKPSNKYISIFTIRPHETSITHKYLASKKR